MKQNQEVADFILNKLPEPPHSAVILGSGLGEFTAKIQEPIQISYTDIPHYPHSSVLGHAGEWVFGYIDKKPIICASGRFHYYEGFSMEEVTLPVSVANSLGCRLLIITNAAGCLKKEWKLGDLMLITGYLDYTFRENSDPPAIVPFDRSKTTQKKVKEIASDLDILLKEGIYTWALGPNYETPAEIQDIISLGGHAVGMSTVPEIIKAEKLGLEVIAISCLTNYGSGMNGGILSHEDVLEIASRVKEKFSSLLLKIV
jgi:purine-nucleoside phosphorylase